MTAGENVQVFWNNFFGPGNGYTLEMINADVARMTTGQMYLRDRYRELESDARMPLIVPRVLADKVVWYAIAWSDAQYRRLGREIQAALGPTYSDFATTTPDLDTTDSIERAVLDLGGPRVYRFSTENTATEQVLRVLSTQYWLWHEQPRRTLHVHRPPGRVLRDFEFALLQRDRAAAEACLDELVASDALSGSNLEFLRIRMLSALDAHGELLSLERLPTVIGMRRPWEVTQAILRAVAAVHLSASDDVDMRLEVYRREVRPVFGELAQVARLPRDPSVAELMAFEAVSLEPINYDALDRLLTGSWSAAVTDVLTILRAPGEDLSSSGRHEPTTSVAALLAARSFEEAFRRAADSPVAPESVSHLLMAAFELDSRDFAETAIAAFEALPTEDQANLMKSRVARTQLDALVALCEDLPRNWLDWYRSLDLDDSFQTMARLDQALAEWDRDQSPSQGEVEELAAQLIRTRTATAAARVSESIPRLLGYFADFPEQQADLRPVYLAALDQLVVDADLTDPILNAVLDLLDGCLSSGIGAEAYREVLDSASDIWERIRSLRRIDWLTDALAAVVYSPMPDRAVALHFLSQGLTWLRTHQTELAADQCRVVAVLARGAGVEAEFWEACTESAEMAAEPERLRLDLSSSRIGIYTLSVGAGRAAKDFLEREHPGVKVTVNSDHVATDPLRAMARNCDVVVVAWASSKHAATEEIRRVHTGDVRWAGGKGASAILRELQQ